MSQSPSKVYTKRLHINGMIRKNNLQNNNHKSYENQYDINNKEIDAKNHKYIPQNSHLINQNSSVQSSKISYHPKYQQKQKQDEVLMNKKYREKQKKHHKKQRKSQENNINDQYLRKNSHQGSHHSSSHNKIKLQKLKIASSLSMKYNKKVILFQKSPSVSEFQPHQKSIKLVKVLNLYPKKENQILRCKKVTAMQKYDYLSQNMRLAQKLLSMKPTRPCDKKEQRKFFKKQKYFKQIRSYSINCSQYLDKSQIKQISQSYSLPKINKRHHTIQC